MSERARVSQSFLDTPSASSSRRGTAVAAACLLASLCAPSTRADLTIFTDRSAWEAAVLNVRNDDLDSYSGSDHDLGCSGPLGIGEYTISTSTPCVGGKMSSVVTSATGVDGTTHLHQHGTNSGGTTDITVTLGQTSGGVAFDYVCGSTRWFVQLIGGSGFLFENIDCSGTGFLGIVDSHGGIGSYQLLSSPSPNFSSLDVDNLAAADAPPFSDLDATKSVSGTFLIGGTVTYTIVLSNSGITDSPDNSGDELTDVLPAALTLVSATATSGTALATIATNTVTWNGVVPAGGTVTVTVNATIDPGHGGENVSNQAALVYDADIDGTNETTVLSDDPSTGAPEDATVFAVTDDGDGVDPAVEDAAPNAGDGNGDGTPDSAQATVASLPSATTGEYLTLETPDGCPLENVAAVDPDTLPADPTPRPLPHGLVAFEIDCPAATVTVLYHGSAVPGHWIYRKHGPTPGEPAPHWYTLPATFGATTVGAQSVATATFDLADAALGDDVLTADGRIVDQGGPAELSVVEVPTLSPVLLLLLALGLGGAGVLALRRLGG